MFCEHYPQKETNQYFKVSKRQYLFDFCTLMRKKKTGAVSYAVGQLKGQSHKIFSISFFNNHLLPVPLEISKGHFHFLIVIGLFNDSPLLGTLGS